MHLESTKLWIDEFVVTVLPLGTTAVAADPHELANVLGVPGIRALVAAAAPLPITFAVYASSCVPASGFERSAASLDAGEIPELIERRGALGVAEVMNFPGVIAGEPEMLARIAAAGARAAFCTDDREPDKLLRFGHVNDCARLAVASGISEIEAILLASTNPARYHGCTALGSLGPGHQADILAFAKLGSWVPARVWQAGRQVARDGKIIPGVVAPAPAPDLLRGTVNIGPLPDGD